MNNAIRGSLNGGVRYPVNNTAYSEEKLCEELPICAEARSMGFENFDMYCSGRHDECSGKILTGDIKDNEDVLWAIFVETGVIL